MDPGASRNILSSRGAAFGDNPFLTLLVTQMRSQTPLDPVDNASFMDQLASFSSMEEQKEINQNLLDLLDFQGALARAQGLGQGSALLGKEVTYLDDHGEEQTGVVKSVFIDDAGELRLQLEGDVEIGMRQVSGIRQVGGEG
jgi:flagellar basal-body rod modification protein FlgD